MKTEFVATFELSGEAFLENNNNFAGFSQGEFMKMCLGSRKAVLAYVTLCGYRAFVGSHQSSLFPSSTNRADRRNEHVQWCRSAACLWRPRPWFLWINQNRSGNWASPKKTFNIIIQGTYVSKRVIIANSSFVPPNKYSDGWTDLSSSSSSGSHIHSRISCQTTLP